MPSNVTKSKHTYAEINKVAVIYLLFLTFHAQMQKIIVGVTGNTPEWLIKWHYTAIDSIVVCMTLAHQIKFDARSSNA